MPEALYTREEGYACPTCGWWYRFADHAEQCCDGATAAAQPAPCYTCRAGSCRHQETDASAFEQHLFAMHGVTLLIPTGAQT